MRRALQGERKDCEEGAARLCEETVALLKSLKQEGQVQRKKIEGIESSVSTLDKVLGYVGEAFRSSKIVEFILNGVVPWRKQGLLDTAEEEVSKLLGPGGLCVAYAQYSYSIQC